MIRLFCISLVVLSCSAIQPQSIDSNVEGLVMIEYKKQGVSYWPYKSTIIINEGELVEFFSSPSTLNTYDYQCNDNWDAQFASDTTKDEILSNPLYQKQPIDSIGSNHVGGEIYYKTKGNAVDSNTIVIAFSIIGSGVLYDDVCEKFKGEFIQNPDCPVRNTSFYEKAFILKKLKTVRKLDEQEIKRYSLIKSDLSAFVVTRCE